MAQTVELYKIKTSKAYLADETGTGWSVRLPAKNTEYYESEVVEKAQFALPEGCRVGEDKTGLKQIYKDGAYCPLVTSEKGAPLLCVPGGPLGGVKLQRAEREKEEKAKVKAPPAKKKGRKGR